MEIYLDIDKTQKYIDYEINEEGYAVIDKDIKVYVFGDSKVVAKDKAIVYVYGYSCVYSYDDYSIVYAYGDNSIVYRYDDSKVYSYCNSKVYFWHKYIATYLYYKKLWLNIIQNLFFAKEEAK